MSNYTDWGNEDYQMFYKTVFEKRNNTRTKSAVSRMLNPSSRSNRRGSDQTRQELRFTGSSSNPPPIRTTVSRPPSNPPRRDRNVLSTEFNFSMVHALQADRQWPQGRDGKVELTYSHGNQATIQYFRRGTYEYDVFKLILDTPQTWPSVRMSFGETSLFLFNLYHSYANLNLPQFFTNAFFISNEYAGRERDRMKVTIFNRERLNEIQTYIDGLLRVNSVIHEGQMGYDPIPRIRQFLRDLERDAIQL